MKKLIKMGILSCLFIFSGLCLAMDQATQSSMKANYIIRGGQTELKKTTDGYTLSVENLNPITMYVSAGGAHKSGVVPTEDVLRNWKKPDSSFNTVPPNSAVLLYNKEQKASVAVELVSLKNTGTSSWSFNLKDLSGKLIPGKYSHSVIFIDSFSVGGI